MSKEELDAFEEEVLGNEVNIPSIELIKIDDIKSDGKNIFRNKKTMVRKR